MPRHFGMLSLCTLCNPALVSQSCSAIPVLTHCCRSGAAVQRALLTCAEQLPQGDSHSTGEVNWFRLGVPAQECSQSSPIPWTNTPGCCSFQKQRGKFPSRERDKPPKLCNTHLGITHGLGHYWQCYFKSNESMGISL